MTSTPQSRPHRVAGGADAPLGPQARAFLHGTAWKDAACEPLAGDASVRRYFRLRRDDTTAILMDASQTLASVPPFVQLAEHLRRLGLSAPEILERDEPGGCLLLEDFGDGGFARLLDEGRDPEPLYTLATEVLIALHPQAQAVPGGMRAYHPQKMLEDIELFLTWRTPGSAAAGQAEFRRVWGEVLPQAHQVPVSLLLRDYHVANLMLLPDRSGRRQAGLLDFQDAYQGPITYDLMSLLEDARREVPEAIKEKMIARYLNHFPALDPSAFGTSMAILAAMRHTRVLAIFERLSRHEGKHDYKRLHSPRVERLLNRALRHPILAGVKEWMDRHAQ